VTAVPVRFRPQHHLNQALTPIFSNKIISVLATRMFWQLEMLFAVSKN
jgi:hypothetical protein